MSEYCTFNDKPGLQVKIWEILYMVTVATLLYVQRQRNIQIPTTEKWIVKATKLAEMAKVS